MLAVQVAVAVVLQVLNHLLGGPLDPPRVMGLWALVPPMNTQVLGLGLDDAPGVVVRERVLRFSGVSLSGGPRVVALHRRRVNANEFLLLCLCRLRWEWSGEEEGGFQTLHLYEFFQVASVQMWRGGYP